MANAKAKSTATFLERKKAALFNKVDVWQGRIARLLVFMILCAQPLYLNLIDEFGSTRYIRLTWQKFLFFVVYMCAILLFVIIVWAARMFSKPRLWPQDKLTIPDWAVLGFAVVTLLSALLSPFKEFTDVWGGVAERYDGAVTQLLFVAVYFIISRWYRPREKDFIWFGVSAILVAFIGILQFYGMDFLRLWPNHMATYYREDFYNIIFRSTLGNVNIVATYVCMAILLCGFLYIKKQSKWRYVWLAGSALNFWLMAVAGSFSGMVGIAVATVLAIPFIIENRQVIGKFMILLWSWLLVITLQWLFYNVIILETRTTASLMPFAAAVCLLLAVGLMLLRLKKIPIFGNIARKEPILDTSIKKGPASDSPIEHESETDVSDMKTSVTDGLVKNEPLTDEPVNNKSVADNSVKNESVHDISAKKEPSADSPIKWKLGVTLLAICILAGLAGVEVLGRSESTGMIYEAREVLHGNVRDEFGTNRIYIWRNALRSFPQHPIIGSGPDTFFFAFPEEAHGYYGEQYDKAHNEYIQILICQGLIGLLCYLVFIGGTFIKAIPVAFKNPMFMAVLATFVGYSAQAIFNISLPIVSQLMWVFAGLLANKRFRELSLQS